MKLIGLCRRRTWLVAFGLFAVGCSPDGGGADGGLMVDAAGRDGAMVSDADALDAAAPDAHTGRPDSGAGLDAAGVRDSGPLGCEDEGPCGDVTGDGCVDEADYRYVGENYGTPPEVDPACDLNGDGVVNTYDIMIILQSWGEGC